MDFVILTYHRLKIKESKKRDKYLDLARELKKKTMESDGDTNCNWCTRDNSHRLGKGTGKLRNQRMSGEHPDSSIIEISQNTDKSPGDLLSPRLQWKIIC